MKGEFSNFIRQRFSVVSILVAFFAIASFGQSKPDDSLQKLTIDDGLVSFVLPRELVVYYEKERSRVLMHGVIDGVSISANATKTGFGLRWLKDGMQREESDDAEYDEIISFEKSEVVKVGDFYIRTVKRTTREQFYFFIESASSSKYFTISIMAKDSNDPMVQRILASISYDRKTVFNKITAASLPASTTVDVFDLKTSEIVEEALKRKQIGRVVVRVDGNAKRPKSLGVVYSRPLILLSKPRPGYTDSARTQGIAGSVKLLVEFKADGDIGEVTIVKDLGSGLGDKAVEAAKKIKFLPAQVDGKAVSSVKEIIYSFAIY